MRSAPIRGAFCAVLLVLSILPGHLLTARYQHSISVHAADIYFVEEVEKGGDLLDILVLLPIAQIVTTAEFLQSRIEPLGSRHHAAIRTARSAKAGAHLSCRLTLLIVLPSPAGYLGVMVCRLVHLPRSVEDLFE